MTQQQQPQISPEQALQALDAVRQIQEADWKQHVFWNNCTSVLGAVIADWRRLQKAEQARAVQEALEEADPTGLLPREEESEKPEKKPAAKGRAKKGKTKKG